MKWIRQPFSIAYFMMFYLGLFLKANIKIAWDILSPGTKATPAIVELPLQSRTDLEITLLSCLISLTPGTLALAIQTHPPTLYVHGIFAPEPEIFRKQLHDIEKRMLKAFRFREIKEVTP